MSESLAQLRTYRLNSGELRRGSPSKSDSRMDGFIVGMAFALFGLVCGAIGWVVYTQKLRGVLTAGGWGALIAFLGYSLFPILSWFGSLLRHLKWPDKQFFEQFSAGQKYVCVVMFSWALVYGGNHLYPHLIEVGQKNPSSTATAPYQNAKKGHRRHDQYTTYTQMAPKQKNANLPIQSLWIWVGVWIAIAEWLSFALNRLQRRRLKRKPKPITKIESAPSLPFSLWLGHLTGQLAQIAHGAALAAQQSITLSVEDAAQNIVILGAIGSGKTTRAMHPLLLQLLDQDCGGLIFDIKGDFQTAVFTFAEHAGRKITRFGPGFERINLVAGLTPEIAASFLKSAFLLGGKGHHDPFWIDTATELCRNTLGLLSFLPAYYSLQGLYLYLFDTEERLQVDQKLDELMPTIDEKGLRLLKSYWRYHERIFDQFDEKVKAGVNATIAQVLSPFNHPELVEAFCSVSDQQIVMEAVLDGAVYLLSLPLSVWGLGGKVAYSLIKLRFYNVMQQRTTQQPWNQDRPVFFMCDEFQEIVSANKDGLSDLNFWDKSRSSKTIGIISAQAVSSFYAAIGDRDIAHALLQNFRQKLCFRTEDTTTLNYFHHLVDKVEVERKSHSTTTSKQSNPGQFLDSTSHSSTENVTLVEKAVLSPQLFRNLSPDEAVALLSVKGHSMDDVIQVMPVYI